VGTCPSCVISALVSKSCVKEPLLGLLIGMNQRGEALGLSTLMPSEKLEICTCCGLGFK
jgi:hypothetical protein